MSLSFVANPSNRRKFKLLAYVPARVLAGACATCAPHIPKECTGGSCVGGQLNFVKVAAARLYTGMPSNRTGSSCSFQTSPARILDPEVQARPGAILCHEPQMTKPAPAAMAETGVS